jgi:ADP-heptose:LPS heptosyltransferase
MDKKPVLAAGRIDFLQSSALISRCGLFISVDNRYMHLARGYQIPSVVIFGGTSTKEHYSPLPEFIKVLRDETCQPPCHKPHCPLKTRACLWNVMPQTVIDVAEELLKITPVSEMLFEFSIDRNE